MSLYFICIHNVTCLCYCVLLVPSSVTTSTCYSVVAYLAFFLPVYTHNSTKAWQ